MDKLTTEQKAERYDKAIEVAKRKLCFDNAGMIDNFTPDDIREIFPELKESNGEEVRKEIMQLIQGMHDADPRKERWLAWLEKQNPIMAKSPQLGEQKPAWSEEDEYYREHLLGWISSLKNYIHYDALVSLEKRRERIDEVSKLENWLKSLKQRIGG